MGLAESGIRQPDRRPCVNRVVMITGAHVQASTVWPGVPPTARTAALSAERRRRLGVGNLLGRENDLEEVARFIAHLADTRNVSGQVFQLDSRLGRWA